MLGRIIATLVVFLSVSGGMALSDEPVPPRLTERLGSGVVSEARPATIGGLALRIEDPGHKHGAKGGGAAWFTLVAARGGTEARAEIRLSWHAPRHVEVKLLDHIVVMTLGKDIGLGEHGAEVYPAQTLAPLSADEARLLASRAAKDAGCEGQGSTSSLSGVGTLIWSKNVSSGAKPCKAAIGLYSGRVHLKTP